MSDQIRVLRVIEYTGDREAVEQVVRMSLHGEKRFSQTEPSTHRNMGMVCIRAATIGDYPEVLSKVTSK